MNLLQRGIRQSFKDQTGVSIDYQNPSDLYTIRVEMRLVLVFQDTNVQPVCRLVMYSLRIH